MPPKPSAKGGKKDAPKKKPMKPKEGGSGGGKAKKKKWSKGKVRDKLNNMVLFDKATYDKFLKEVPQYKVITPSAVSERLKIGVSLARSALAELNRKGMKVNRSSIVETNRLWLVPYCHHHVSKYHDWMENESLRIATSSERLSYSEECEAQLQWQELDDRLTFIVLLKESANRPDAKLAQDWMRLEEQCMIGDVNLFLLAMHPNQSCYEGELSVMIAEPDARGQGLAAEALAAMLFFVANHVLQNITSLVAKVSLDNASSLRLFQHHLQFRERMRCAPFNEVELVPPVDPIPLNPSCETENSLRNPFVFQAARHIATCLHNYAKAVRELQWRYEVKDLTTFRDSLIPKTRSSVDMLN